MLFKVLLNLQSVDETLVYSHSNESDWAVLSGRTLLCFIVWLCLTRTRNYQIKEIDIESGLQSRTKELEHEASYPLPPLSMLIIRWFLPFLLEKTRYFQHWCGVRGLHDTAQVSQLLLAGIVDCSELSRIPPAWEVCCVGGYSWECYEYIMSAWCRHFPTIWCILNVPLSMKTTTYLSAVTLSVKSRYLILYLVSLFNGS